MSLRTMAKATSYLYTSSDNYEKQLEGDQRSYQVRKGEATDRFAPPPNARISNLLPFHRPYPLLHRSYPLPLPPLVTHHTK